MSDEWKEWGNHILLELKRFDKSHEQSSKKLDRIESRLDRYNESLTRNTVTLEEHVRRTTILEQQVCKTKEDFDKCRKMHIAKNPLMSFLVLFKVLTSPQGKYLWRILIPILGGAASYHFVLRDWLIHLLEK